MVDLFVDRFVVAWRGCGTHVTRSNRREVGYIIGFFHKSPSSVDLCLSLIRIENCFKSDERKRNDYTTQSKN